MLYIHHEHKRWKFLQQAALLTVAGCISPRFLGAPLKPPSTVRILVWDERQPAQRQAYENFLGNQIADHLRTQDGFSVVSAELDEPEQGLSERRLDDTDVLIWWGHKRQAEITLEKGRSIVQRIVAGSLSLVALHSAHWSTPFMEAMNEITRLRFEKQPASVAGNRETTYVSPPQQFTVPKYDSRLTPYSIVRKYPDGREKQEVHLPFCCFPAYRNDGKPSTMQVMTKNHPIAKDIPSTFVLRQTEMYDEPFHVPEPDEVVFEERWETGEWFRTGMTWQLGKGKIFYFRPGHETFAVYKEPVLLRILTNAALWLGKKV